VCLKLVVLFYYRGSHDSAVGWGTALLLVRFPLVSLEFSIDIILLAALWPVHRADSLTRIVCQLFLNVGAETYCNLRGLSRPVQRLKNNNCCTTEKASMFNLPSTFRYTPERLNMELYTHARTLSGVPRGGFNHLPEIPKTLQNREKC